jgi:tetratricopeptide (TPR) repeat protein
MNVALGAAPNIEVTPLQPLGRARVRRVAVFEGTAIDTAIDELNHVPLSFFCGAGISARSGIPLVGELVPAILEILRMTADERHAFLQAGLPFESVMEVLLETGEPEHLFDIFSAGEPNIDHILLAKLSARSRVRLIVTTNFDTCVEQALRTEGVPFRTLFRKCELERNDWRDDLCLVKLHGSVDDRKSLALTIRSVANQTLIDTRKAAIINIFARRDFSCVVVIGYSCSDRFDLNPALESIKDAPQRILLIQHAHVDPEESSIADVSSLGTPFSHFSGKVLRCNTDDFIAALWTREIGNQSPACADSKVKWQSLLEKWYEASITALGEHIGDQIAGLLLKHAGRYQQSTRRFLRIIDANTGHDLCTAAHQFIGDNYRDQGDYVRALEHLRLALGYSQEYAFRRYETQALASLGVVFEDLKDHRRAIACYKRAARLGRRLKDRKVEGICNGNLGIAYKNLGDRESLSRALRFHENGLRIAREIGDKPSEGRTLGNLGITYSDTGDKHRALQCYKDATRVAQDLGDLKHVGIWAANAGMDLCKDNPVEAAQYLNTAIRIFADLGLAHHVDECKDALSRMDVGRSSGSTA